MVLLHIITAALLFVFTLSCIEVAVEDWPSDSVARRLISIALLALLLTACILLLMGAYNHQNA